MPSPTSVVGTPGAAVEDGTILRRDRRSFSTTATAVDKPEEAADDHHGHSRTT
jgi:hypothetical protein